MSIENIYGEEEITERKVKEFLKEINLECENIGKEKNNNSERDKKKKLQKLLKEKFGIKYIKTDWINNLYSQITIKNIDISKIGNEIQKLKRNSERFEKFYNAKLGETVSNIKNNIVEYLEDNLSVQEKQDIFKKIEPYTGKINSLKDIEIGQTLLQTMGKEHILITLVVQVNGKKLNIGILKNKKTGKIVENFITKATEDLHGGNKKSGIERKLYDNPDAGFVLNPNYTVDKNKFNLENNERQEYISSSGKKSIKINFEDNLRNQVKNGEKDNELNIFIQLAKEWNKIFKKNKEELEKAKTKEEKEHIINKNAQAIADLFADNASLQGTMDFDNSYGMEGIKGYFLHFLESLPTMRFSRINKINLREEGLLIVQGDYIFEVDDGKGGRTTKDANFKFYFEKNEKTGKWGIKRLKSTFGKTEDNLKEV